MASILSRGFERWPTQVAVADDAHRLTYRELYLSARRLASRLLDLGVRPGDRIAVAGPRTADTVTAILAISVAGAAYVPLDATQPAARLSWLMQDADVCGEIASEDLRAIVASLP